MSNRQTNRPPRPAGRGHVPPEGRCQEPAEESGQPGVARPQLEGHVDTGGEERRYGSKLVVLSLKDVHNAGGVSGNEHVH